MTTDNPVLAAALEYAAMGWHVFPVIGKRPATDLAPHWSTDATTDPALIEEWFSSGDGLGIGVDMARSGLAAIDGDHIDRMPPELLDALGAAGAWQHRGNPDRRTYVFTVNGTPVPQTNHAWGEVKSAGGYIVLAPSPHEIGGEYVWLEKPGQAPPAMPSEIAAMVAPAARTAQEPDLDPPASTFADLDPAVQENVQRWTDATVRGIVSDLAAARGLAVGERDDRNRGWERLCADAAYRLARMALADWCPLTGAEARSAYFDNAPTDADWHAGKVSEKWDRKVASAKREGPEPWRSDFEGVGEEAPEVGDEEVLAAAEEMHGEQDSSQGGSEPGTVWLRNSITEERWKDRKPPTPPTVMRIKGTEGALFARGRVSRLFGLSGSAKSWCAKQAAAEVLAEGGSVLYMDADSIFEDFRDHMILLGVTDEDATSGRLHYIKVEGSLPALGNDYRRLIESRDWDLVVLDGFNASLSLAQTGKGTGHEAQDVDRFFHAVLNPPANRGAAVVVIDHMRKDGEADFGSVQKRNDLTGSDYSITRKSLIAPEAVGYAAIKLTSKDRGGWATSVHAKRGRDIDQPFAYLIVDSTVEGATKVQVVLDLPPDIKSKGSSDTTVQDAATLLHLLEEVPEGFESTRQVRLALQDRSKDMDNARINAAADFLESSGDVVRPVGKRGAKSLLLSPDRVRQ